MHLISNRKGLPVAVASASLAALACTCGALSGLTQVAQQAEAVATQAVAVATVAAAEEGGLPDFGDGEIPDIEGLTGLLGGDIDACALITADEAQAVIGGPMDEPLVSTGLCIRQGVSGGREVSILALATGTPEMAVLAFQPARDAAQETGGYEEISGSWNEGIYEPATGSVYFWKDQYFVLISTGEPDVYPNARAEVIQLATLAAGRLP